VIRVNDDTKPPTELTADAGASDFDVFFATYAREVAAVVTLTTRDVALAEDATQEAMTRAYQRWPHVGALDRPDLWVIGVATRLAIDAWRKRRHEVGLGAIVDPGHTDQGVQALLLKWELEELAPQDRLLVILRHRDGLSNEEIGRLIGKSTNTVAIYLKRARRRLRLLLSGEE
jgi:RNA polymerase sigma-70 factor (ECF subfamily)